MKQEWSKYKLIVFDLDNTLYCETDYLFAAYHRIAEMSATNSQETETYYNYLCTSFVQKGREGLFQRFKEHYAVPLSISQMLSVLRNTECPLTLYQTKQQLIKHLLELGKNVAILTNGNNVQQHQKVTNLQIEKLFPQIMVVYASEIDSKPSPVALQQLMKKNNVTSSETLYIGDDEIDYETALNAGVDFANVVDE